MSHPQGESSEVALTIDHDLSHLFKADLFDRLRDLPLVPIGVEKHEDAVSIELVDRFRQDLKTGFLHHCVDLLEIRHQQCQCNPEAVRAFTYPSGPNLMLVMKLI